MTTLDLPGLESVYYSTNGVRLHAVQSGPDDGPLVILLHGFPEFWYGWRNQIGRLAEAGFRVLVPDQRGYNLSEKPSGSAAYHLDELAGDAVGLIESVGRERANLVGHDWGAAVAFRVASQHPEKLRRLVIINVPHPNVMAQTLRRSWKQRMRSWYILFFQLPWLPEVSARLWDWYPLVHTMRLSSLPGTFTEVDFERYREAWERQGAFTAMLNWYRAALWFRAPLLDTAQIEVPTLIIWGAKDAFLELEMARKSADLCFQSRLELLQDATHWVHHEMPERVNLWLLDFLLAEDSH